MIKIKRIKWLTRKQNKTKIYTSHLIKRLTISSKKPRTSTKAFLKILILRSIRNNFNRRKTKRRKNNWSKRKKRRKTNSIATWSKIE